MIPTWSSTAATAYITYPPASILEILPPPPEPAVLSPPQLDDTFARPFDIDPTLYNDLLNVQWPLTIAAVYAIVVYFLNKSNQQRENKPWAIAKSWVFYLFVLLHNIFLAAFSLWTFAGMLHAIRHTWPGFEGEHKWAAAADALCKLHGPRGLGSAATFDPTTSSWGLTDTTMKLFDNLPDYTDVGRLWNEGLGFYGWLFYVSKFYEVVDTFIILAKGKNTSMLQTFHHAGAMMCMWAGIRYMSPPIWMFVLVNSGLHGLMYIYYTLSTLEIRVPFVLKRVLTSLQIIQFVFGASYALAHLFVAYDIPVSVPYLFIHNLSSALPSAASSVSSAVASATATAGLSSWLKKAALRAAGEEGLAMNVRNDQGEAFGIDAVHAAESEKSQEETRYRLEYQTVNCLDTSGQTFAILLNVLYLAPLTILFLQFFVKNYILGTKKDMPPATRGEIAKQSAKDAVHDLEQEIKEAMENVEHGDEMEIPPDVKARLDEAKSKLRIAKSKAEEASRKPKAKAGETAEAAQNKARDLVEAAQQEATDIAQKAKDELKKSLAAIKDKAQKAKEKVEEKGGDLKEQAGEKAEELKDATKKDAGDVVEDAEKTSQKAKDEAEQTGNAVKDEADSKAEDVKDKTQEANDKAESKVKSDQPAESTKPKEQKSKIPKRDKSPVKRDPSPVKSNASQPGYETKPRGKENVNGEDNIQGKEDINGTGKEGKPIKEEEKSEPNGLDESAYEINADELKSDEEKKAEAEMQPKAE